MTTSNAALLDPQHRPKNLQPRPHQLATFLSAAAVIVTLGTLRITDLPLIIGILLGTTLVLVIHASYAPREVSRRAAQLLAVLGVICAAPSLMLVTLWPLEPCTWCETVPLHELVVRVGVGAGIALLIVSPWYRLMLVAVSHVLPANTKPLQ